MNLALKKIRSVIAKSIPFSIRRLLPINIIQHLYFSGSFTAFLYGKPVVKFISKGYQIENEIYWRGIEGCHEGRSMQVFSEILSIIKPQVIWDIGANSGTYGVLAKALNKNSQVFFFEPIPKAAEMVRENLFLNGFDAKVFQVALGDYDGDGQIYFGKGEDFATSVTVNKNTLENDQLSVSLSILVRRADSLMKQYSIPFPNLVKLDVETYEFEVLNGFGIKDFEECIFLIEILSDDLATKVSSFFSKSEYDYYNIDDKNMSVRKTQNLEKSDFYNYLICPKSLSSQLKII